MDERVRSLGSENWKILKSSCASNRCSLAFLANNMNYFSPELGIEGFCSFLTFPRVRNDQICSSVERVMAVTNQKVETGSNSHKVATTVDRHRVAYVECGAAHQHEC